MSDALSERRLSAIILGDVVGYSRLMGVDEVGTMTALKAHRNELVLPALAAYRARMVDATGDAMLMECGSAVSAVSCAITIQRLMVARNADVEPERRLQFRFGINLGDVVVDGEQIFGDGVNVAARLESFCQPGGICISRSIEEQIRGKLPFPFVDEGELALKNIAHPIRVFRLPPDHIASLPEPALPTALKTEAMAQPRIVPGALLNDTYKIDSLIGSGGMGEIFRGHEIHSGGLVAIKVIRLDMIGNKTAAALFQKEALVLKDINHDAIVRYFSFSFDPPLRRHYLAMEFVDGMSLSELSKQGALSFEAVSSLCRRVAAGLQIAHGRGVVHRDISSDNIIIPMRDVSRAKIIDFGIARTTEIGGATIIGNGFAGKYNYVSPEQLGLEGGEITAKSDIYSFGLVLAEASLGAPLDMGGTQAEVIDKRRSVPDLRAIDPRLRPLIERMLQPDPGRRPTSMEEVARWPLEAVSSEPPDRSFHPASTPQAPTTSPRQSSKGSRPIERLILGGALALVLTIGSGVVAYQMWFAPTRERPHVEAFAVPQEHRPESSSPPSTQTPGLVVKNVKNSTAGEPTSPPVHDQSSNETPSEPQGEIQEPLKSVPPASADRVEEYIKTYNGGDCFLAVPVRVTDTSAAIDGFAQSKSAFEAFDQGFTKSLGFSPDIVGNKIWSRQCPALDFLRRASTEGRTAPTLFLKSARIGRTEPLAGEVHGYGPQSLALLQVQEDGAVVDVSSALKRDGSASTFDLTVSHAAGPGPLPQLLMIVASSRPLTVLGNTGPKAADRIFGSILDEAKARGNQLSVSAKLFLLTE